MSLDTMTSLFTIIGGTAGVIGTVISAIALSRSKKANKTANEALSKITQYTTVGQDNINAQQQKIGKDSRVINGHNNSM
ncbi:hypothetical protein MHB40_10880 [Lysinibacillus sp. FSL K6-0057]|uniref:hypothetical protein n=1 Tax=Lysinibacillus sp. FSL K6-0057 TaxID=2921411 RepID=UPI00315A8987